jgi:hypothetical protein
VGESRSEARLIFGRSAGTSDAMLVVALQNNFMRVADTANAEEKVVEGGVCPF